MVAFVVVSHSSKLAEGVVDIVKMSAPEVKVFPAGGLCDGEYGTDFELISEAVKKANCGDGVIIIYDIGSAAMTSEMVVESLGLPEIKAVDCPMVEGAVLGTVLASAGAGFDEIVSELEQLSAGGNNDSI